MKRVILRLGDVSVGKRDICLISDNLECVQFSAGLAGGIAEQILLFAEGFRIRVVQLQQLVRVLQLRLSIHDLRIDILQSTCKAAVSPSMLTGRPFMDRPPVM